MGYKVHKHCGSVFAKLPKSCNFPNFRILKLDGGWLPIWFSIGIISISSISKSILIFGLRIRIVTFNPGPISDNRDLVLSVTIYLQAKILERQLN